MRPYTKSEKIYLNDAALFVKYPKELIPRGIFKLPMNLKRSHLTLSHTEEHISRTLEA